MVFAAASCWIPDSKGTVVEEGSRATRQGRSMFKGVFVVDQRSNEQPPLVFHVFKEPSRPSPLLCSVVPLDLTPVA